MNYTLKHYKQALAKLEKKEKELHYYLFEFSYDPFKKFRGLQEVDEMFKQGVDSKIILAKLDNIKADDEKELKLYEKYQRGNNLQKYMKNLVDIGSEIRELKSQIYWEERSNGITT